MADTTYPALALALTEQDRDAVVAAHSAEHGYPHTCKRADGRPAPAGVPCTVERATDPEPVLDQSDPKAPKILAWTYPAPSKPESLAKLPAAVRVGTDRAALLTAAGVREVKPIEEKPAKVIT